MTARNNKKGFTIIELLIVIVVIGILAAIGFVAYGNVTKSARDSDRQADASAISKKAEIRLTKRETGGLFNARFSLKLPCNFGLPHQSD